MHDRSWMLTSNPRDAVENVDGLQQTGAKRDLLTCGVYGSCVDGKCNRNRLRQPPIPSGYRGRLTMPETHVGARRLELTLQVSQTHDC